MRFCSSVSVLLCVALCSAREFYDKLDRYLIACHSTDFVCFKKQYQSLRDNFLLGSPQLGLADYEPYYFRYGDSGTCIKLSGLEESRLVGIGIDSDTNLYTLILELPLKIQQVRNDTQPCSDPAHAFSGIGEQDGPLKKFTGNATVQVIYPYDLKKKKGNMHMILGEEGLDVILDIPDLEELRLGTQQDIQEYELSEWAYELVQHINAAQDFALPFTSRLHTFTAKIALERYLLLYPEEEYTDIHFAFTDSPFFDVTGRK
ncbi:uncharacterized protein LOC114353347 [Ostrinia furnacalis]|uniref:uncharacterized protein LOC114353347 n=1 Tax=Ostrinia furnacalis TaxID=93504 RepID=UPI00103E6651|nr:uncharacterized protein LOC114353347 [Ostrinia furnacalis]